MPRLLRRLWKTAFLICCFSIALTLNNSPALAQGAAPWQRYNPRYEDFSVLLPEQPLSITIARPKQTIDEQLVLGRIYSTYTDGTVFLVYSIDNFKSKETFQDFAREFKSSLSVGEEATFEKDIRVGGHKGKQYRFKAGTSAVNLKGVAQFFIVNERAYAFVIIGEEIDKPMVNQFLSSIRLDKGRNRQNEVAPDKAASVGAQQQPAAAIDEENRVYTTKEVTRKAVIVSRPRPIYTEEARQNNVTGTVVLRAVFGSVGLVTNIKVVKGLPDGLTERAIVAARNLRFIPAMRDGKYISQYIQIEYNFNLY